MAKGVYQKTEEHKRKLSEALKGRKFTKAHKKKLSEIRIKEGAWKGEKNPMYGVHLVGENSRNWKGGQFTSSQGYVHVVMSEHPRVDSKGYVRRSHLIAEKTLGRYLYPDEITHHKNGIKDDDRPENIEVTTKPEHSSFHRKMENIRR